MVKTDRTGAANLPEALCSITMAWPDFHSSTCCLQGPRECAVPCRPSTAFGSCFPWKIGDSVTFIHFPHVLPHKFYIFAYIFSTFFPWKKCGGSNWTSHMSWSLSCVICFMLTSLPLERPTLNVDFALRNNCDLCFTSKNGDLMGFHGIMIGFNPSKLRYSLDIHGIPSRNSPSWDDTSMGIPNQFPPVSVKNSCRQWPIQVDDLPLKMCDSP